jgi:hypothetical protein
MSQKIVNQNINTCAGCHNNVYQIHQKDAHYNVPCVDCHGAGNLHVSYHKGGVAAGSITKEQAVMLKEYTLEGCLFCHRKLKARPSDFPQVSQEEHYKFLNVIDEKTKCIECHNPHEPAFLLTDVKQSRIHPIVSRCTECHDKKPENSPKEIADHPVVFVCKDCHSETVKDFSERPHNKYVECSTCHLFHKESDNSGRIYKNGNAKFCLLCHEKKSFKNEKYPPKIEWPAHVGNKDIIQKSDEKICLNCHIDQIHRMDLNIRQNPHDATWKLKHKEFARNKMQVCQGCHTQNDCNSCHMMSRPSSHNSNWTKLHSKSAANNKASCETCHKKDGCISCHGVDMPHPQNFAENHKEIATEKGKTVCLKCHEEQKVCAQCH